MNIEFSKNNIIVYDSNPQGQFISPVSIIAKKCGADRSILNGHSGYTFAVCTHDLCQTDNKIPVTYIQKNLISLCSFAFLNPEKTLYLPYFGGMPCFHSSFVIESIMPHLSSNIKRLRV
jgi:hypothetical protein